MQSTPLALSISLALMTAPLAAWPSAEAPGRADNWFTVAGDPLDTARDTVQVDPVAQDDDPRTMRVRVSRSMSRISWDGVPYRSYVAMVLFDCRRARARYQSIRYHLKSGWVGDPHRTVDYTGGTPRLMEFREMTPNPMARIIAAACGKPPPASADAA